MCYRFLAHLAILEQFCFISYVYVVWQLQTEIERILNVKGYKIVP